MIKNNLILSYYLFSLFVLSSGCVGYLVDRTSFPMQGFVHLKSIYPSTNWKNIEYFEFDEPTDSFDVIAKIIITGNEGSSEQKLIRKMKQEAAFYGADAVICFDKREVPRLAYDGFSATANLIATLNDDNYCEDYYELDTGGIYNTLQLRGVAILFKEN